LKLKRQWDAGTGELRQTLQGHSGSVWSVAFSADGRLGPFNFHERWISSLGSKIILLPEDRQVSAFAVQHGVQSGAVAVGSPSGVVTIINIRLDGA